MADLPLFSPLNRLHTEESIHSGTLLDFEQINADLLETYLQHHNLSSTRKSHHFMGRFENTYIPLTSVPAMRVILQMAETYAQIITGHQPTELKRGFWFNEMHPGQQTSLHTHEENNEVLSAVYYIMAPKDSGDLVVKLDEEDMHITPKAGRMILFTPDIPHRVERNDSSEIRLSVAINFGIEND